MVSRTWKLLAGVTALLGVGLPLVGAVDGNAAESASPAQCVDGDPNREPGIQGDVPSGATPEWDCGVTEVGFLADAGGEMAVAGTCAYTGGGADADDQFAGVRVIDVSNPRAPRLARVLETGSRELLAARITATRGILATRHRDTVQQEGQVLGRDMLVDIWNIFDDCTDPQLLGTLRFPTVSRIFGDPPAETGGPAHNLTLNPTATKVYGSIPMHEADITDLANPENWTVRNLHCAIANQYYPPYKAAPGLCEARETAGQPPPGQSPQIGHEPVFNPDGSRLYLGAQLPVPGNNDMWIVNMEGPDPVVESVTPDAPGHSIDFATINGNEYLLHSNEIGGNACVPQEQRPRFLGFADRAYMLDITDEKSPEKTSELILADSKFENCSPSNTGGPSTAYHDIDDPLDSTYAVIGFGSAGFRFFDIRDPKNPVEAAYFNHGQTGHTKPYIRPDTGHIWVTDADGFRVLELEPQVVAQLGLTPPS